MEVGLQMVLEQKVEVVLEVLEVWEEVAGVLLSII